MVFYHKSGSYVNKLQPNMSFSKLIICPWRSFAAYDSTKCKLKEGRRGFLLIQKPVVNFEIPKTFFY